MARCGSAPRVRGTRRRLLPLLLAHRFSPACAGNALPFVNNQIEFAVQPRVCGERKDSVRELRMKPGSAPRVRGTQASRRMDPKGGRFSPACAGNAPAGREKTCAITVQPRVCGERPAPLLRPALTHGSAPRVRGTRLFRPDAAVQARFSPACAGNAKGKFATVANAEVQPRVCGERDWQDHLLEVTDGSAPRVRGTRGFESLGGNQQRFSPACAGNAPER